ncbi:MAG: CoA pyrophosphatase [Candidatus Lokiarchaeota archaeon]|jgi:8-oxo-dGTP pyrophosphatase MutT (NUDIX family)|nr:CoA pyrophosphatase [Candidatus Lokiarchaeota archaeon]
MDSLIFDESFIKSRLFNCESPSRISLKDNFFTSSAVLFSIIPYKDKPFELILIHRSNLGTRHRGEMSFPGGKFEDDKDKSLKDTALRETEEEIGVSRDFIKIIGCLDDFPTMTKYIITPYVAIVDKNQKLIRQKTEVQKIIKIPIDFFTSKTHFREQAIDVDGHKFPVFYFNYLDQENGQSYLVWGATAYMIVTFIEMLYGFTLSNLGLKRFKLEKIKDLKEYIKYRNNITKKF